MITCISVAKPPKADADLAEAAVAAINPLRKRATAAAFTLLGIPSTLPAAKIVDATPDVPRTDSWALDTSVLRYSEAERITVVEPQIAVQRNFSDNRSLSILTTVDTITGATPL